MHGQEDYQPPLLPTDFYPDYFGSTLDPLFIAGDFLSLSVTDSPLIFPQFAGAPPYLPAHDGS